MKELRPGSTGRTEIRVLFAFDKERKAILLLGGDKSDDWAGWYAIHFPPRGRPLRRTPSKGDQGTPHQEDILEEETEPEG